MWKQKKRTGTLKRPSFAELFSPRDCADDRGDDDLVGVRLRGRVRGDSDDAAANRPRPARHRSSDPPKPVARGGRRNSRKTEPGTPERGEAAKQLAAAKKAAGPETLKAAADALKERRGNIQRWQELGGLTGRILLAGAADLRAQPHSAAAVRGSRRGAAPRDVLLSGPFANTWCSPSAIFFCGLLTVAQFSFLSEFLPRVFPMHLRGTGGSFATNFGGRMIGTMAATLNTEVVSKLFPGSPPMQVAAAAAVIGGTAYLIALVASFVLPAPKMENVA